jgi:hypothetical protein
MALIYERRFCRNFSCGGDLLSVHKYILGRFTRQTMSQRTLPFWITVIFLMQKIIQCPKSRYIQRPCKQRNKAKSPLQDEFVKKADSFTMGFSDLTGTDSVWDKRDQVESIRQFRLISVTRPLTVMLGYCHHDS